MGDLLYLRHSTDKQTNARQLHALEELLKAGAPKYEDPATSSRVYADRRPGFSKLLKEAAVGDTVRIADAARLFRSTKDVIQIREILQRRGLHLRIATGAWSGFDLAADDPQTKLFVTMLAGVLEFTRDMISENTKEGVAAAAASGKTLGRPAAFDEREIVELVEAYRAGTAVKALARQYGVAPKTVRRALDAAGARDDVPADLSALLDGDDQDAADDGQEQQADADPIAVVDVPGLVAEHLADVDDDAVRQALATGQTIRRGQGYSVRVTAPASVHTSMVELSAAGLTQSPAGRKAHRIHSDRVSAS